MRHRITEDPFAFLQPFLRGDMDVPAPVARLYLAAQIGDQKLVDAASMALSNFTAEADFSSGVGGYEVYYVDFQFSGVDRYSRTMGQTIAVANPKCPELSTMVHAARLRWWKSIDEEVAKTEARDAAKVAKIGGVA